MKHLIKTIGWGMYAILGILVSIHCVAVNDYLPTIPLAFASVNSAFNAGIEFSKWRNK